MIGRGGRRAAVCRACRARGRLALIMMDMQRDVIDPGGFGASLGNDVSRL
jgi:hypothetical protein